MSDERSRATHLLNRIAFGPRPGDVAAVLRDGPEPYLRAQLESDDADVEVEARLQCFPMLRYSIKEFVAELGAQTSRTPLERMLDDLRTAKLLRAVHSRNQLKEVLVDFWYNHFNVYLYAWEPSVAVYDREAIRPHALGRFRDLLGAVASHPAMLFYLDNYLSKADRVVDSVEVKGLNENFGRELLELHTVGVDAGYSQDDVISAARVFTGWGIEGWGTRDPSYRFAFSAGVHDVGSKRVFGLALPAGGGREEGGRLLDHLASHPATARFVSTRLVQRFVSDVPEPKLVQSCTDTFLASGGEIRAVMGTILGSAAFAAAATAKCKFKTPFEFVVSALRAVPADFADGKSISDALARMGMPLYECRPPTGYSNAGADWLNPAAQVARIDFALNVARGHVPRVRAQDASLLELDDPQALIDAFELEVLGQELGESTRQTLARTTPDLPVNRSARVLGLLLASPEFQSK